MTLREIYEAHFEKDAKCELEVEDSCGDTVIEVYSDDYVEWLERKLEETEEALDNADAATY